METINLLTRQIFDPWAGAKIFSWRDLRQRIDDITSLYGQNELFWRGVQNADWGLESSLYRRLKLSKTDVTEPDLIKAEIEILKQARRDWRFDQLDAIEIFAHIQHYGGPTRLLDVSSNPLIASWFAVEDRRGLDGNVLPEQDARVFCFVSKSETSLSNLKGDIPPWHLWTSTDLRKSNDWGTGRNRRFWRPPAYNERISAQNAAFLLDGVYFGYPGSNTFTKAPGDIQNRWKADEIRSVSSIPIKLNDSTKRIQRNDSAPVFNFVIDKSAQTEIRKMLESNYGYSKASIYGDLYGLAQHVLPNLPRENGTR